VLRESLPLEERIVPRKRGIVDVFLVIVAAALVMSPSFLASIELRRLGIGLPIVAISSLALFLIGVFLLVRTLKD